MNLTMGSSRPVSVGNTIAQQTGRSLTAVTSPRITHSLGRHRQRLPRFHTLQHSELCVACTGNGDSAQATDHKNQISIDLEPQAEGEYCMPGEVFLDNESHEQFTILRVEVKDYPGLLRVIAWVVNGLELVVQNARYSSAFHYSGMQISVPSSLLCGEAITLIVFPAGSRQRRTVLPTTSSGSPQMVAANLI